MDDVVREFEILLTQSGDVCSELLSLARMQRDALVSCRIDDLVEIAARQTTLTSEAYRLNRNGESALERIAGAVGLGDSPSTLTQILDRLPRASALRIGELRSRFTDGLAQLAQLNQTNTVLIESALAFTHFTVQLFAGQSARTAPTYCGGGLDRAGAVLVDRRA